MSSSDVIALAAVSSDIVALAAVGVAGLSALFTFLLSVYGLRHERKTQDIKLANERAEKLRTEAASIYLGARSVLGWVVQSYESGRDLEWWSQTRAGAPVPATVSYPTEGTLAETLSEVLQGLDLVAAMGWSKDLRNAAMRLQEYMPRFGDVMEYIDLEEDRESFGFFPDALFFEESLGPALVSLEAYRRAVGVVP